MGRLIAVRRADGNIYQDWEPLWYDWLWMIPLLMFILFPLGIGLNLAEWFRWRFSR